MFATFALTAFLASAAVFVRADAIPSDPGPGVVYQVGGTCHITWTGDTSSTTAWQNMAIELMTGDNFDMIHLTTVAENLDGTTDGTFDHICPDVTPNAAIYFYQFTAPAATDKEWTTRFTIASSTGATTDPTNTTQPDGEAIPWGTGALVDPSTAVAAPDFAVTSASSTGAASSSSSVAGSSNPSTASSPAVAVTTSGAVTPTTSGFSTVSAASSTGSPSASAANATTTTTTTQGNAASSVIVNSRIWQVTVALGASAMAFALLL